MSKLLPAWALPIALLAVANLSATWYKTVSIEVPEPYLDEIFHVPQAQRYCNHDWSWDPKITTPPGLYLASLLLKLVQGHCSTSSLRAVNVGAICFICLVAYGLLRTLRIRSTFNATEQDTDDTKILDAHSALNISLFPPLFFFSGLYYTDVISTLAVLLSFGVFLKSRNPGILIRENIVSIFIGIVALLFRQTNVFWVAIFPAGLAIIDVLKREGGARAATSKDMDFTNILKASWNHGVLYDCAIQDASLSDSVLFLISTGLVILRNPFVIVRAIAPFILLIGIFASFVAWNGGVVLGDKSAHVATIHLPQMLYIWPYIVFFSAPLTVAVLLRPFLNLSPVGKFKRIMQDKFVGHVEAQAPSFGAAVLFLAASAAAVHYNTIIHPYTLADNRHYVFYIFRILRQHPANKYLAVPFYYAFAWMAVQTLGSRCQNETQVKRDAARTQLTSTEAARQPCQLSFVIIWLATSALCLVTAPLVEPRYFIVPWIVWRLHVPYISASPSPGQSTSRATYDMRLVLETVWLLAINAVIGYNFIYRGFSWPNEPGKMQRFLW